MHPSSFTPSGDLRVGISWILSVQSFAVFQRIQLPFLILHLPALFKTRAFISTLFYAIMIVDPRKGPRLHLRKHRFLFRRNSSRSILLSYQQSTVVIPVNSSSLFPNVICSLECVHSSNLPSTVNLQDVQDQEKLFASSNKLWMVDNYQLHYHIILSAR